MLRFFEQFEANPHSYISWFLVIHLVLLTFCDVGRAGIIVYDGNFDVEEFPDTELWYTQQIRRSGIEGVLVAANPLHACVNISGPPDSDSSLNWFVLMSGNACSFETKVLNARQAGYSLGIIYRYRARVDPPSNIGHIRFYSDMPAVIVKTEHGIRMKDNYLYSMGERYRLLVYPNNSFSIMTFLLLFSIVAGLFLVIMLAFTVIRFFQQSSTVSNGRLSSTHLRQLQITTYQKGDLYETCAICLEDYKDQDKLRILPCSHGYHMKCIDPWLTNNRRICPVCKRKVVLSGEPSTSPVDHYYEEQTETTPLLVARSGDSHGTFNYVNVLVVPDPNFTNLSAGDAATGDANSTLATTPAIGDVNFTLDTTRATGNAHSMSDTTPAIGDVHSTSNTTSAMDDVHSTSDTTSVACDTYLTLDTTPAAEDILSILDTTPETDEVSVTSHPS